MRKSGPHSSTQTISISFCSMSSSFSSRCCCECRWTLHHSLSSLIGKTAEAAFWLCVTKPAEVGGWLLSFIQLCLRDADGDGDLLLSVDHLFLSFSFFLSFCFSCLSSLCSFLLCSFSSLCLRLSSCFLLIVSPFCFFLCFFFLFFLLFLEERTKVLTK